MNYFVQTKKTLVSKKIMRPDKYKSRFSLLKPINLNVRVVFIPKCIPNQYPSFKRFFFLFLLFSFTFCEAKSQADDFPYTLETKNEIYISVTGLGLQTAGYFLNKNKDAKTFSFANANRKNIPGFDRWGVNYHSDNAATLSDVTELGGVAMPLSLCLISGVKSPRKGIILFTMYAETMLITTGMINTVKGAVCRYRPYVYSGYFPANKNDAYATKSFYSGHTSATAASSFFAAKVFSDLYPNSKLKPYVWAMAAAVPAATGSFRIKAGRHFLSDVMSGYITGAACGLLVPRLHKKKKN